MIKAIIWDMDMTLVDSSSSESFRKSRQWSTVYNLIPNFKLYAGIKEVLKDCSDNLIRACIVTTSPSSYANRVLKHFGIPSEFVVDYFSCQRKPSPDPMLMALKNFGLKSNEVISIGDRGIDIQSSRAAGIKSIGCLWGTQEEQILRSSIPDYLISNPLEIIQIVDKLNKLQPA